MKYINIKINEKKRNKQNIPRVCAYKTYYILWLDHNL